MTAAVARQDDADNARPHHTDSLTAGPHTLITRRNDTMRFQAGFTHLYRFASPLRFLGRLMGFIALPLIDEDKP